MSGLKRFRIQREDEIHVLGSRLIIFDPSTWLGNVSEVLSTEYTGFGVRFYFPSSCLYFPWPEAFIAESCLCGQYGLIESRVIGRVMAIVGRLSGHIVIEHNRNNLVNVDFAGISNVR